MVASKPVAEREKSVEEDKEVAGLPGKTGPDEQGQDKEATNYVITKFLRKGFNSLSAEDLAATMVTPDFASQFRAKTSEDWESQYRVKVIERLENAKFDLRWLTKANTLHGQFGPLFELCKLGNVSKVVEFIKKNGDDTIFAVDVGGKSPLHIAAANGHTQLVETLINMGSAIDARDRFLRTPLHLGASGGYETVVNSLLNLGADPTAKDRVITLSCSLS